MRKKLYWTATAYLNGRIYYAQHESGGWRELMDALKPAAEIWHKDVHLRRQSNLKRVKYYGNGIRGGSIRRWQYLPPDQALKYHLPIAK